MQFFESLLDYCRFSPVGYLRFAHINHASPTAHYKCDKRHADKQNYSYDSTYALSVFGIACTKLYRGATAD